MKLMELLKKLTHTEIEEKTDKGDYIEVARIRESPFSSDIQCMKIPKNREKAIEVDTKLLD